MKTANPRRLILFTLLQATLASAPVHADVYDDMRNKYLNRASTAPALDPNDPDVALQQTAAGTDLPSLYWSAMDPTGASGSLWPSDYTYNGATATKLPLGAVSANMSSHIGRLNTIIGGYTDPNSPLYNRADVLQGILTAYDWILANAFTSTNTGYDNWYDWQIGAPQSLNSLMVSFYGQLSAAQIAAGCGAIDHHMSNPTKRENMDGSISSNALVETGSNLLDKAWVSVLRGVLGKDGTKIAMGRDAISGVYPNVTTGDGFYADGTFIQHSTVPYIGSYGQVLISDLNKLYYMLNGSSWPITDPNYLAPFNWIMNSFAPYMYDGAMMDNQRGRAIARQFSSDHITGRSIIYSMAEFTQALPDAQAAQVKSLIKGWVQRDTSFGASYFTPVVKDTSGGMSTASTFDIAMIKGMLNDTTVAAADEPGEARFFPSGDRAVSRRPGHGFAVSMFSTRTTAFESLNGENLVPWWDYVGTTNLYNADQTQYDNNYWATVNSYRLAGTTTDHSSGINYGGTHFYANTKNTVGGAELNRQFITVGMDFGMSNVTQKSLTGKKAWFLFGDRMVAVGAGISSTDNLDVETIVENRMLDSAGDNALTVNTVGNTMPSTLGWTLPMPTTKWAHLAGNAVSGSDIGYVFPDQPVITGLRETRSGKWTDVNTYPGYATTDVKSNNFLSLAFDHGSNPSNAAYTYILLPNRTAQQTSDFAAANPITVLERSINATAVNDSQQGLTGIVFWNDLAKTVSVAGQAYLSSDKKAIVTIQQQGNDLQLAVSDPTQLNTGVINLELFRTANNVISNDPAITVTQTSPTIKMAIAVNGAHGKSFNAHFDLISTVTLAPTGDAMTRDGTYANTNYGGTTPFTIKKSSAGYNRKAVIKFDLSSIVGTISSASLKLVPTSVGMSGMSHNIYQSTFDDWAENAVTWNTQPANGGLITSFSVPAVFTPVQVDLTTVANSVLSGDKILALEVESGTDYGSNGYVDYASKEHTNASYRPTLTVISH